MDLYSADQLEILDKNSINSFDRKSVNYFSDDVHKLSNNFWHSSFIIPALLALKKDCRNDLMTIGALWGETIVINAGITVLVKYSVQRTRPFVYNPDAPTEKKLTTNAKSSFFSGHTSMTAANTFFAAKVFSDYYPNSNWKPVVWSVAATIPAITGYLRVKAGKHFPTDTIVGYSVGALTGFFVPHLHKSRVLKENGLTLYGGPNGLLVNWQF